MGSLSLAQPSTVQQVRFFAKSVPKVAKLGNSRYGKMFYVVVGYAVWGYYAASANSARFSADFNAARHMGSKAVPVSLSMMARAAVGDMAFL